MTAMVDLGIRKTEHAEALAALEVLQSPACQSLGLQEGWLPVVLHSLLNVIRES